MPHDSTPQRDNALSQAEMIAHGARREEIERLVKEYERSEDRTLRSLARAYRLANSFD